MIFDGNVHMPVHSITTTISLGTPDENVPDGEIRKEVEMDRKVTSSTGDKSVISEESTYLVVDFLLIHQSSNVRPNDNSRAESIYETDIDLETDSNSETESDFEADTDLAADSSYETERSFETDRDLEEVFSDYEHGDEVDSDTESIKPEEFICEENGRTYNVYGTKHWGPNDEAAREQQDLSHHFWTMILEGKYCTAPLKNPQCILDLGTGTGIWAMDVGDEYPSARVIGIDVSAMQPMFVPPNVQFIIEDFNAPGWDQRDEEYDLIHGRELLGSVMDWPELIKKCYRALKPGGYLNLVEPSIHLKSADPLPEKNPLRQWEKTFIEAGEISGMSFDVSSKLKGWMEEAGFVEVVESIKNVDVGGKSELGKWNRARLYMGVFDFSGRRLTELGWSPEEIMVFVARIKSEIKNPKSSVSQEFRFVHGQKPV